MKFPLIGILPALGSFLFADAITVSYSGRITSSDVPGIAAGDSFTGSFTYSTSSEIPWGSFPLEAIYSLVQVSDNLLVHVNGYTFTAGPSPALAMTVSDGPNNVAFVLNSDYLDVQENLSSSANFSTNYQGLDFVQSAVQIVGNLNFLQSNALPNPFHAEDVVPFGFQQGGGQVLTTIVVGMRGSDAVHVFSGPIDQIEVATPEPQTWPLLLGISMALLFAKRTPKRKSDADIRR